MAIFTPKERQELEANDTRNQKIKATELRFELSQVIDTKISQANALITALYNQTYQGRLEKLEDMDAVGELAKEIRVLEAAKQAI